MSGDRRLAFEFGDFRCELSGFEDPIPLLDRAIRLYADIADHSPALEKRGGPEAAAIRARFAEALADRASGIGAEVDAREERIILARRAEPAKDEPAKDEPALRRLASMDPGLLAEFVAMRARLKEPEEPPLRAARAPEPQKAVTASMAAPEPAPAAPASAAPAPVAAISGAAAGEPRRPRVRVIRAADRPAEGALPAAAARPAAPAPSASDYGDNFLFAAEPPLVLGPSEAAPDPRPKPGAAPRPAGSGTLGFLRRMIPEQAASAPAGEEAAFRRLR